jgi:ribonuclease G
VNELIIDATEQGVRIALLQDKKLIELHQERHNKNFNVGDIYLGTIKKITPSLNSAFVDIGHEKPAFLHYHDLGPNVRSVNKFTQACRANKIFKSDLSNFTREQTIEKSGKMANLYQKGEMVLVQITKEPISTKGPRLSSEISLAGRFIVLVPFSDSINISKKIKSSAERTRLRNIVQSMKLRNFGVIIRTVAEGKADDDVRNDLKDLMDRWQQIFKRLKEIGNKQITHEKVVGEVDKTQALIRDMLSDDFSSIVVNNTGIYNDLKTYIARISPEKEKIVKFYNNPKQDLFDTYGIERQIKSSFAKTVTFSGGCYLVIEHTEAMHVIDINSGSKLSHDSDQEETAIKINQDAAKEVARQLRLRDMGGLIIVDFIDVRKPQNKRLVYEAMREAMANDRARHKILPLSTFGLLQITRQRVRPEMTIDTVEVCPQCKGTGEVNSSSVIVDEIENNLKYLVMENNIHGITLATHPYIAAYIKQGILSLRFQWWKKYKEWVNIVTDEDFHYGEYHFLNKNEEEIKI